MAKSRSKSQAVIMGGIGPDGTLQEIPDARFEKGKRPVLIEVPPEQAETWLQCLTAECASRSWSWGALSQLDPKENSGSVTVTAGGDGNSQLAVVWDRRRDGPLRVRARSSGSVEIPVDQIEPFLESVNARSKAGPTVAFHLVAALQYDGLPWLGELWLNDGLRLGPPSQQYEKALLGPRVILVDSLTMGIDAFDAQSRFDVAMRELSVFLSVVLGTHVDRVRHSSRQVWTFGVGPEGNVENDVRRPGYIEKVVSTEMPSRGTVRAIPRRPLSRPDFSFQGVDASQSELDVPEDIADLWQAYSELAPDSRRQFLQSGSMWQLALSLDHEHHTTRFAWMVAACEALKLPGPQFDQHNCADVVDSLLGRSVWEQMPRAYRPQRVRNDHLHRGEFFGPEFVQRALISSYLDPTFDMAARAFSLLSQSVIIEWLRKKGSYTMPPRRGRMKGLLDRHPLWLLAAIGAVCAGIGFVLGKLLR